MLSQYDLKQLSVAPVSQIMQIHGIKKAKAAQIAACFELSRRLEVFKGGDLAKINSPEDVYRLLYPRLRETKREIFIELCLDTKKLVETGKVMGIDVLDHLIIGDGRHFSMKEAGHI
jgi:DNA repair protein RadC